MERHSDNKKWKQWNLESAAKILEKRFPNSFVWVVRPSRYHLNTFACYQNFVETNMFGVPDHRNPEYGALKHLRALLEAAVRKSKFDHRVPRLTIASSKPNCKNWYGNLWSSFSRRETKTSKLAIMTLLGRETVIKQQREISLCGMYTSMVSYVYFNRFIDPVKSLLFGFGEAVVSVGSLWCDRDAFDFLGLDPRRLMLV